MRNNYWLTLGLALLTSLMLREPISVAKSEDNPDPGRRVGLVSSEAECLAVQSGVLDSATATLRLQWEGEIQEAFLTWTVTGSQGGHSIYVNGQRVGSAPARPGGSLCRSESTQALGPTDTLSIPIDVLVKGENSITLTNDANSNDGWAAAHLRLEIHGILSGPPPAALESAPAVQSHLGLNATAPISDSVLLTSSYELIHRPWLGTVEQLVSYQVPMSYTDSISVPLLIGIHGMGSYGQVARDFLAAEANARGWLLAAPDMHGRYYVNDGRYALAYVGAQHDIMDTVAYMMSVYDKVDPSRIYVTGGSMGGQTCALMAAKYSDVFAAAVPWKPLTDLSDWYYYKESIGDPYGGNARIENETGGIPSAVPFEYQRRSPLEMPQNSRLIPIKMWHDVDDELVPIRHSRDLKNAINSWDPLTPVTLIEVPADDNDCPPDGTGLDLEHCYNPPPADILDFLSGFTFNTSPPLSLTIRTDESKPYHWLNIAQTGGDHWSEVQAAYSPANKTVTATISDTQPLDLAFNLGSTPIAGRAGLSRSGMGLPATTYLVSGGGNYKLENYISGYLTASLSTVGQFTLTLSAIEVELSASPAMVLGWQTSFSTISVAARDRLGNLVPDGTPVQFSTSEGVFPNANSTVTMTTVEGQADTVLTLASSDDLARVIVSVESITTSTSVDVIHPALDVLALADQNTIYSGQFITYTYRLTNSGDITLSHVTLVAGSGTVCENITLAAGATQNCAQSVALYQTTTITATASGQDPLGNSVSERDAVTVDVISPAIDLLVASHPDVIYWGESVTYTYQITNSGDVTLTGVTVTDSGGAVCENITLLAGATQSCTQPGSTLFQTLDVTATVTGQDPLGNDVTASDSVIVTVLSPAIDLRVTPHQTIIYRGEPVTYTYQITNSGDITLTSVIVTDDEGIVCENITLAAEATQSCLRSSPTLSQVISITAHVTGQDPWNNEVSASDSITINAISPAIAIEITPRQTTTYQGQIVTYTYQLTNSGDTPLSAVTVVDDNGTPGDSYDDLTVCANINLAAGATHSCQRGVTATRDITITASVVGQDLLNNNVVESSSAAINVIAPAIKVQVTPSQIVIDNGEIVTYTYQITNIGDTTLTGVILTDDNGTPGNAGDDLLVCADITLAAGAMQSCSRSATLTHTLTSTATVWGQDLVGNDVLDSDSTIVIVALPDATIYLPIVARNG